MTSYCICTKFLTISSDRAFVRELCKITCSCSSDIRTGIMPGYQHFNYCFPEKSCSCLKFGRKYQTNQINRKNTYPYSERNRLVWHNNDLSLFVKPPLTHPQTAKTNAPSLHQTGAYLTWANRICVFTCPERHRNIHWSSLNEIRSVSAKDLVWVMDNLRPVPTEGRYG